MRVSSGLTPNKKLNSIQTYQPGMSIEDLERERGLKGVIKMASNENAFGPSPKAVSAIAANIKKIHRYPDTNSFALKSALSKRFKIDSDRIVLGNGSDELIVMAVRAFLGASKEAVMAIPTFLIYRIATQVQGGHAIEVPMRNYRYDLVKMAQEITEKTKIVFVANPDNPVGTYVTHEELEAFINRIPSRCIIFIDEAYYEFASHKRDFPKSFSFLDRPNIIISRTFSKAYGISGLRIGYAFTSKEIARSLNKVREPFNVNVLAQVGALAALEDTVFLKKVIRLTEQEKRYLKRELAKLRLHSLDSATNFLLVHFGPCASEVYEFLLRSGVIVRHMKDWGLGDHLRITIGTARENRIFVRELRKIMKSINEGESH